MEGSAASLPFGEVPERPPPAAAHAIRGAQFEPPRGRARATIYAFYAFLFVAAATIAADIVGLRAVDAGVNDKGNADSLLNLSDTLDRVTGIAWTVSYLAIVVLFLRWFYRVNKNLPALGIGNQRTGAGWAVGSFLVPIANFFVPKMAANDVWRSGATGAEAEAGQSWLDRPVGALLHWWWAVWIVTSLGDNMAGRLWLSDPAELEAYRKIYTVDLITTAGDIVAALLAMAVIRRLTRRQEARAAELGVA